MDHVDLEYMAYIFRCEAGVVHEHSPVPSEAAIGYQLRLVDDVPKGAEGGWDSYTRTIHYDPYQSVEAVENVIAHECDHAILGDNGVREDEQEEHAGKLCVFWRAAYHKIMRIYHRHGFVPQRFLDAFHGRATHAQILVRCALAVGVGLIVYNAAGERIAMSLDAVRVDIEAEEEGALVEVVRMTGRPHAGPCGVVAYPFAHRRRTCVALVLDYDRCLMTA